MLLLGLDDRDVHVVGTAPQNRRHRDTGGASADDKNLMMLPVRHWSFSPDLLLSARELFEPAQSLVLSKAYIL
jgi:hypothetical protein